MIINEEIDKLKNENKELKNQFEKKNKEINKLKEVKYEENDLKKV